MNCQGLPGTYTAQWQVMTYHHGQNANLLTCEIRQTEFQDNDRVLMFNSFHMCRGLHRWTTQARPLREKKSFM